MARVLHFISGLPRSGSTLLSALLRQNPRFSAGVTSPLAGLCGQLQQKMANGEFSVFFDEPRRAAMLRGLFESYYGSVSGERVVFDTNRMWTGRIPLLAALYPQSRIICCVRDVSWILDVIAAGLLCAIVFEAVLTALRSYLFSHTTSKLDVELGAKLFRHLLSLPIAYFQSRRAGDSVARIRELEQIRSFLTGNALTLVMDLIFSVVFIGVMFWYSPKLTLVVALSIPAYAVLSLVFTPMLRARLNEKFNRGAENHAFLVETISGMDTVKAMAVEPRWIQQWERQLAGYVGAALRATTTGQTASAGVTLISKLVTLAVIWVGAGRVMSGELTVGELIAFNMLASQVSNPILRLAQMWNDFQQVGISMERLGDILNAHPRWRVDAVGCRESRGLSSSTRSPFGTGQIRLRFCGGSASEWRRARFWVWLVDLARARARSPNSCNGSMCPSEAEFW